jgi:major membrane immunogen (membrane-anchored lipoprotein)
MKAKTLCLLACALCVATACRPMRVYRVTFSDGTYDYYELDYRPANGATSIEYQGETIIGVEKIEPLKN